MSGATCRGVPERRTDLPHVTDLLKGAGLVDTSWMTDYARDRGTAVHLAIALLHENDLDEESLDPAVAAFLPAYKQFIRDVKPGVHATEVPLENLELGYCGTADLEADLFGRPSFVDYKCGAPSDWHPLQTAGYAGCRRELRSRFNLYLKSDGTYRLVEHTSRGDWPAFKAVIQLYQWRKGKR